VGPLLPTIQDTFSISVAISGALVSASTASVGVGTGLTGLFVRKFGEQKTVLLGMIIFSVPLGASALLRNFSLFAPLFIASGLGGGLMTTPTYSIAAALFPKRKGTAIGFVSASYNLGGFIGPTLSGVLLNYLGWQYPFFAMGLIGIFFTIIFQRELSGFKTPSSENPITLSKEFKNLLHNRNILAVAISMALADFGFLSYITYTVQYFGVRFNLNSIALVPVDFYFGIAVGIGGLGIITAGLIYDRMGGKIASIVGAISTVFLTLALYSVSNLAVAILLLFVAGFFINSFWGVLSAVAQANVPDFSRASAVSFVQTVAFVGAVLGPVIAALLFQNTVSSGPLIMTVTLPYAFFALIMLVIYSTPMVYSEKKSV
jgi:MFS family permease